MRLAEWAGQWQYLRGKSNVYVEIVRSWVTPAAAAGAFAKFVGVPSRWAIVVAIVVPLVVEALGYSLGRFLYNHGGVEREYQLALDRDPWKRESLRLAVETAKEARALRLLTAELCRLVASLEARATMYRPP